MITELTQNRSDFMTNLWLDLSNESLADSPKRVAKMYINDLCKWLFQDPPKITTFPNDSNYDDLVLVKNIQIQSLCEHHFLPFIGTCHVAYYPKNKIIWLSKFSRIVDHFARKPQVQERLNMDIYTFLVEVLDTDDVAVYIESEHFCMKLRWVKEYCSTTITKKLWWRFIKNNISIF